MCIRDRFNTWQVNQQLKRAETVYNTIYAFMATATEEEYDEVSRSRLLFASEPGTTAVTLTREDGEVSVQRIKALFCEDCFSALADIQVDTNVLEFVLFDSAAHAFYPIMESGEYTIENYNVSILRDGNDYELTVSLEVS